MVFRALDDIQYHRTVGDHGEMVFHIDSKHSKFKDERVDRLSYGKRRKLENLFILTYPNNQVRFSFD